MDDVGTASVRAVSSSPNRGAPAKVSCLLPIWGLPYVRRKFIQEHRAARTPSVVRRWSNLADRWDRIATDVVLNGDFSPNARGVEPADDLVLNLYVGRSGEPNHHKSWGYLRPPNRTLVR